MKRITVVVISVVSLFFFPTVLLSQCSGEVTGFVYDPDGHPDRPFGLIIHMDTWNSIYHYDAEFYNVDSCGWEDTHHWQVIYSQIDTLWMGGVERDDGAENGVIVRVADASWHTLCWDTLNAVLLPPRNRGWAFYFFGPEITDSGVLLGHSGAGCQIVDSLGVHWYRYTAGSAPGTLHRIVPYSYESGDVYPDDPDAIFVSYDELSYASLIRFCISAYNDAGWSVDYDDWDCFSHRIITPPIPDGPTGTVWPGDTLTFTCTLGDAEAARLVIFKDDTLYLSTYWDDDTIWHYTFDSPGNYTYYYILWTSDADPETSAHSECRHFSVNRSLRCMSSSHFYYDSTDAPESLRCLVLNSLEVAYDSLSGGDDSIAITLLEDPDLPGYFSGGAGVSQIRFEYNPSYEMDTGLVHIITAHELTHYLMRRHCPLMGWNEGLADYGAYLVWRTDPHEFENFSDFIELLSTSAVCESLATFDPLRNGDEYNWRRGAALEFFQFALGGHLYSIDSSGLFAEPDGERFQRAFSSGCSEWSSIENRFVEIAQEMDSTIDTYTELVKRWKRLYCCVVDSPQFLITPTPFLCCPHCTTTIAVLVPASRGYAYLWQIEDTFFTQTDTAFTWVFENPGSVEVCVRYATGCDTSSSFCQSVNVLDTVWASIEVDTNEGCAPFNVTVNYEGSEAVRNCDWIWGDGTVSTGCFSQTHTYDTSGTYIISLDVSNHCGSKVYTTSVTVHDGVCSAFIVNPICGGCAPLEVEVFYPLAEAADSFYWDFGDGTPPVYNESTWTHTFSQGGEYTISLTAFRCGYRTSSSHTVSVEGLPEPDFSWEVVEGPTYTLRFTPRNDGFPEVYCYWDFGDETCGKFQNSCAVVEKEFPEPGVYTVCLWMGNDCGDTVVCDTVTVSGIKKSESPVMRKASFSIFPNPVNGYVVIGIQTRIADNAKIEIYDVSGKLIKEIKPVVSQIVRINTTDMASGKYYVRFVNGEKVSTRAFDLVK